MYNINEEWQRIREDSLSYMRNLENSVVERWLDEIGYVKPVAYYRNIFEHTMEIYTTNPGVLIGKAGSNVEKLREILREEFFGQDWKVKFIEIRGGFVNVNR